MAINKVYYKKDIIIDLTGVTVTPNVLKTGYIAIDKDGNIIEGTYEAEALEPAEGVGF